MFSIKSNITPLIAVLASSAVSVSGENVSSNTLEEARVIVAAVAKTAAETGILRDMAVIAARNAIAAENDADEVFIAAIKSGDKSSQASARKKFNEVSELAGAARDMLQKISDYNAEVAASAGQIRLYEKEMSSVETEKEADLRLRKIQKLSASVAKTLKSARALAEILKKQWLLPVVPQPVVSVTGVDEVKPPLPGSR